MSGPQDPLVGAHRTLNVFFLGALSPGCPEWWRATAPLVLVIINGSVAATIALSISRCWP